MQQKWILVAILLLVLVLIALHMNNNNNNNKTLYERLGGVYGIAAVVDRFSDALIQNPIVGVNSANPQLRDWHRNQLGRLPGLKFMRTLWVCEITGGPFRFHGTVGSNNHLNLREAHQRFQITSDEFDAVALELKQAMDDLKVPETEQQEILTAFSNHKANIII